MKTSQVAILGLSISLSSLALAVDFSRADNLFHARDNGTSDDEKFESSTQAHNAYKEIYNSNSINEEDRLYAFVQMGRLDLFRGGLLDNANLEKRKEALRACANLSRNPAKTSKLQEHHYVYTSCLAALGKISNFLERIDIAFDLRKEEPIALETTKVNGKYTGGFEGGGILRIIAGIKVNKKAEKLGLYNPQEGMDFTNTAIQTPETLYKPFYEAMSGSDFYDNFYYLEQGRLALGVEKADLNLVKEARANLKSTVETIYQFDAAGALTNGRKPEILRYAKLMSDLEKKIGECDSKVDWKPCLEEMLEN